jgi:uncharacterized protein with GYD domain
MAKYVTLVNWTDQGVKNIKDTVKRAEDFTRAVAKYGAKVETLLWTMGEYDVITIISAPNEEAAMKAVASVAAQGNVRTKTLRAFDGAEVSKMIADL